MAVPIYSTQQKVRPAIIELQKLFDQETGHQLRSGELLRFFRCSIQTRTAPSFPEPMRVAAAGSAEAAMFPW